MLNLNLKPASQCRYDAVSLGEIMLRLDPGEGRIRTAREFKVWEGGGEYNVVRGLHKCFGMHTGVLTAFAYSLIQLLLGLDNVGYATTFATVLGVIFLDYVIAYTVIGFSGAMEKPFGKSLKAVMIGIAVVFVGRFLCHYITGVWIWGGWMPENFMNMTMTSPWMYSLLYNGWYMLAELVVTEIAAALLYKPLKKFIHGEDIPAGK